MTPEQREAAERLIVRLDTAPAPLRDPDLNDDAAALLRELAAEPAPEPVAWRSRERINDGINDEFDSHWIITSTEPPQTPRTIAIEPLFAAPQQRKPLSADQIRDAVNDPAFWATSKNFIFRIARAIECAHGITGEPT